MPQPSRQRKRMNPLRPQEQLLLTFYFSVLGVVRGDRVGRLESDCTPAVPLTLLGSERPRSRRRRIPPLPPNARAWPLMNLRGRDSIGAEQSEYYTGCR